MVDGWISEVNMQDTEHSAQTRRIERRDTSTIGGRRTNAASSSCFCTYNSEARCCDSCRPRQTLHEYEECDIKNPRPVARSVQLSCGRSSTICDLCASYVSFHEHDDPTCFGLPICRLVRRHYMPHLNGDMDMSASPTSIEPTQ